jgi:hypothetical protein
MIINNLRGTEQVKSSVNGLRQAGVTANELNAAQPAFLALAKNFLITF